jgi:UDP-N-acetylmuramoyl-tripeptide--D-alanyl-D-alanine ligase
MVEIIEIIKLLNLKISLSLFLIFWLIVSFKKLLFWIWLWQLKEYHLGRFLAHFDTAKGKALIFNKLSITKIVILFLSFFWSSAFLFLLVFIFALESSFTIYRLSKKQLGVPRLTLRTIPTLISGAIFLIIFSSLLYTLLPGPIFYFSLVSFDIFSPLIFSLIVLAFEPFASIWRLLLIRKARLKRAKFRDLLVIGITGSYGKTSTKEFLAHILSKKFKVLKTKEHQNSEIGISQCILKDLKPEHQIFVCEMGTYDKGGIKLLAQIIKPKIGIVTGINEQHLATFRTMKNLISAEGGIELAKMLPQGGVLILNGENNWILKEVLQKVRRDFPHLKIRLYFRKKINLKLFTTREKIKQDIFGEEIKVGKDKIYFKGVFQDKDFAFFKLNLVGAFNIENIFAACLAAKELGIDLEEIAKAAEEISQKEGAMRLIKNKKGIEIIDSSYSANPYGTIAALEHLRHWNKKRVIVMPCLIELGPAAEKVHKRIGEKIAEICDLAIIVTKDYFKELKEAVLKKGMTQDKIVFLEKPEKIIEKLNNFLQPEDVVLFEGRVPRRIIESLITNNLKKTFP